MMAPSGQLQLQPLSLVLALKLPKQHKVTLPDLYCIESAQIISILTDDPNSEMLPAKTRI